MASPAWVWPMGMASMPARTCSAVRDAWYMPRQTMAVQYSGSGISRLSQRPASSGKSSGTTKNQMNICNRSGTLRNIST